MYCFKAKFQERSILKASEQNGLQLMNFSSELLAQHDFTSWTYSFVAGFFFPHRKCQPPLTMNLHHHHLCGFREWQLSEPGALLEVLFIDSLPLCCCWYEIHSFIEAQLGSAKGHFSRSEGFLVPTPEKELRGLPSCWGVQEGRHLHQESVQQAGEDEGIPKVNQPELKINTTHILFHACTCSSSLPFATSFISFL